MLQNLHKQKTRFVIARNPHQALTILGRVRFGTLPTKHLYLTRDAALIARNKMRMQYRKGYQVFEVPYTKGES